MGTIIDAVVNGLLWLINLCYGFCGNYWIAIFIFTFMTKVILLPLSVWVQKNSIKTVRMSPEPYQSGLFRKSGGHFRRAV